LDDCYGGGLAELFYGFSPHDCHWAFFHEVLLGDLDGFITADALEFLWRYSVTVGIPADSSLGFPPVD
jgi:hypothetical protein